MQATKESELPMGLQIIKQPNGKFGLFSSVSDGFTAYDCTPDELVEVFLDGERNLLEGRVAEIVAVLNKGGKPYFQFTMNWDEAIAKHNKNGKRFGRTTNYCTYALYETQPDQETMRDKAKWREWCLAEYEKKTIEGKVSQ